MKVDLSKEKDSYYTRSVKKCFGDLIFQLISDSREAQKMPTFQIFHVVSSFALKC